MNLERIERSKAVDLDALGPIRVAASLDHDRDLGILLHLELERARSERDRRSDGIARRDGDRRPTEDRHHHRPDQRQQMSVSHTQPPPRRPTNLADGARACQPSKYTPDLTLAPSTRLSIQSTVPPMLARPMSSPPVAAPPGLRI